MPGHAGNFLTRLFSLSETTFPHLAKHEFNRSITAKKVEEFDRLDRYSFEQKKFYVDWMFFHKAYIGHSDIDQIEIFSNTWANKYSSVIYSIHPAEFIRVATKILKKNIDLYHVELDLDKFGEWVEQRRKQLKFITRPNEADNFLKISSTYNTKAISLTKMLESEHAFLDEYNRVCKLMEITPMETQAIALYRNWKSFRLGQNLSIKQPAIKILSRPPHDDFTFSLFNSIINLESPYIDKCETYYCWATPPSDILDFLNNFIPTKPNVIIGIKDLLDLWRDFNWWTESIQGGSKSLIKLANKFPNTNFIIFTSLEKLNREIDVPNIKIIPWGGDLTNQASAYSSIVPVLDKNFNSSKTFISLNRHARPHRLILLSYLFGAGYNTYGDISYLHQDDPGTLGAAAACDDLLSIVPWVFHESKHRTIREKILTGFKQIYNNKTLITDEFAIYKTLGQNNNFDNFNNKLRHRYKDSFVEIVTESSFSAPSFLVTEKTLHSIYGCNFPIILSGVGCVQHLRDIGFDLFDDIIDHSYDLIDNPFDRIIAAVENNRQLLLDSDYVKNCWKINKQRFKKNIILAQTDLYNWYQNRAISEFKKLKLIDSQ